MIAGKNNLLVSGCSFTKGHVLGDRGSFATYLGEMTNTKVTNVAKGGHGNEMINFTVISTLENYLYDYLDDVFVIVGWSECFRSTVYFEAQNQEYSNWISITAQSLLPEFQQKSKTINEDVEWMYKNSKNIFPIFSNFESALMKTYQNMILLKNYLENKKIPYLFFDAINDHRFYEHDGKFYLKASSNSINPFELQFNPEKNINDLHLHGSNFLLSERTKDAIYDEKFYTEVNMSMNAWLEEMDYLYSNEFPLKNGDHGGKYTWDNDGHPGSHGSKEWAKLLLRYINKLYK